MLLCRSCRNPSTPVGFDQHRLTTRSCNAGSQTFHIVTGESDLEDCVLRLVRRVLRLTPRKAVLLAEASVAITAARMQLKWVPFTWIRSRKLEREESGNPRASDDVGERIAWSVATSARRLPGTTTCLAQSLAAQALLLRRSVGGEIHLGVGKDDDHQLGAHAWLTSGDAVITGEDEAEDFSTIATFPF